MKTPWTLGAFAGSARRVTSWRRTATASARTLSTARRSASGGGPPLADITFESFARSEVERLEEERLAALMDRIDCELALGHHDELVSELESLVEQHPLRSGSAHS